LTVIGSLCRLPQLSLRPASGFCAGIDALNCYNQYLIKY
jgi:hypothetical protein